MNTRGSTPNEPMSNNGSKPRTIDAAEGSIVVNAPVAAVYKRWLAFEGEDSLGELLPTTALLIISPRESFLSRRFRTRARA